MTRRPGAGRLRDVARAVLPAPAHRVLRRHSVRRQIRTFPPRVVEHEYGGHRLRVALRDPLAEGWYDHDWGLQAEIELLKQGRLGPGALVFDVGAHQGVVALLLAREVGEHGHVVAVEAEPHNAEVALENKALNDAGNLTVIPAAISDRPGRIFFSEGLNGTVQPGGRAGKVAVEATTIDELATRFGEPDVVFVDVEGFEERALAGARRTLARGRTDVFVELHDRDTLSRAGASAERVVGHLVEAGCDCRVAATRDGAITGAFSGLESGLHLRGERCYLVATGRPAVRRPGV
ncbi:MAG: hypothetical protein QOH43_3335 [Solirubrobacteraceae bacterium]|nr:hypothetical protein [Solirubrobacteraceae bacterium]